MPGRAPSRRGIGLPRYRQGCGLARDGLEIDLVRHWFQLWHGRFGPSVAELTSPWLPNLGSRHWLSCFQWPDDPLCPSTMWRISGRGHWRFSGLLPIPCVRRVRRRTSGAGHCILVACRSPASAARGGGLPGAGHCILVACRSPASAARGGGLPGAGHCILVACRSPASVARGGGLPGAGHCILVACRSPASAARGGGLPGAGHCILVACPIPCVGRVGRRTSGAGHWRRRRGEKSVPRGKNSQLRP